MSAVDSPSLVRAAFDSVALLEFSRLLNTLENPEAIYSNVLLALMGKMGLSGSAVALPHGNRFVVSIAKGGAVRLRGEEFAWESDCAHGFLALDEVGSLDGADRFREVGIERIVPVSFGQEVLALILVGGSLTKGGFGAAEESYAQLLAGIAAIAVDGCRARGSLREANRRLERRVHRLRSLFEASREFNALLAPEDILRLLGFSLMGEMAVRQFAVAICEAGDPSMVVNRFRDDIPSDLLVAVSRNGPRLIESDSESVSDRALYDQGVRATIPMEVQGKVRGILLVGERLHAPICDEDVEYLASLSNLAIGALENMRLLEEIIVKNRLEEDLRIAAEIQRGLLPAVLPVVPGFSLAARSIPTHQVGGDFYDAITFDDGRILVAIADVSGKGTPASLIMANVQAAVRALSGVVPNLAELVARVNDLLHRNTASDKFVTAFFGILDPTSRRFQYVNAGHNPPFLFGPERVTPLVEGGLLLGIMPSIIPYEVGEIIVDHGDLLMLYTDGISEALNNAHEEFGEDRLKDLFTSRTIRIASDAIEILSQGLMAFTDGAPQSDDMTAVAILGV